MDQPPDPDVPASEPLEAGGGDDEVIRLLRDGNEEQAAELYRRQSGEDRTTAAVEIERIKSELGL